MIKLRSLLRDYIDRLRTEWPNTKKIRERIIKPNNFSEKEVSAPLLAPPWTRAGYEGKLKYLIINACNEGSQHRQLEQDELANPKVDNVNYNADIGDENEDEDEKEEEEEVLLTSCDHQSNSQYSDDSYLEMDDD